MSTSKLTFSKCQESRGLDTSELPSYGAAMAGVLNLPSCGTSATTDESVSLFGGGIALILVAGAYPIPLGGAGLTGYQLESYKETNSYSCEQMMALAQRNYNTSEKIKCIMGQNSAAITTVAEAINSIQFESDGDVKFVCPDGFDISQNINIKVNNTSDYSDTQIEEIKETLIDNIKGTVQVLQESESGWAATPQGSRSLQEIVNKVSSSDFAQQVRQTVIDITSEVQADNSILMKAKKDIIITGNQCKIKQESILDIVAQTMINNTMRTAFEEYRKTIVDFLNQAEAKSKNEGMPTLAKMFQNIKTYAIIGGIVILVIIIGVIIYSLSN